MAVIDENSDHYYIYDVYRLLKADHPADILRSINTPEYLGYDVINITKDGQYWYAFLQKRERPEVIQYNTKLAAKKTTTRKKKEL